MEPEFLFFYALSTHYMLQLQRKSKQKQNQSMVIVFSRFLQIFLGLFREASGDFFVGEC